MFEENEHVQKVKNQIGFGNIGSNEQLLRMLGLEEQQE